MDRNHTKKQQFILVKLKTARGVSTSTNMPVSNVVEVFGDLEDDDHLDALDAKNPKHDSGVLTHNGKFMDDLVDDTRKKVGAPPTKTGIWLGRNAESSSESGFTSPNHFDLLTKEDVNTILLNIHESDNDVDVENGCDDTATSSKSLGNLPGGNT
ncbi:hypothetical protein Tco_1233954 [Tanacetum coccineum]